MNWSTKDAKRSSSGWIKLILEENYIFGNGGRAIEMVSIGVLWVELLCAPPIVKS